VPSDERTVTHVLTAVVVAEREPGSGVDGHTRRPEQVGHAQEPRTVVCALSPSPGGSIRALSGSA